MPSSRELVDSSCEGVTIGLVREDRSDGVVVAMTLLGDRRLRLDEWNANAEFKPPFLYNNNTSSAYRPFTRPFNAHVLTGNTILFIQAWNPLLKHLSSLSK